MDDANARILSTAKTRAAQKLRVKNLTPPEWATEIGVELLWLAIAVGIPWFTGAPSGYRIVMWTSAILAVLALRYIKPSIWTYFGIFIWMGAAAVPALYLGGAATANLGGKINWVLPWLAAYLLTTRITAWFDPWLPGKPGGVTRPKHGIWPAKPEPLPKEKPLTAEQKRNVKTFYLLFATIAVITLGFFIALILLLNYQEQRNASPTATPTATATPNPKTVTEQLFEGTSLQGTTPHNINARNDNQALITLPAKDIPALTTNIAEKHWYTDTNEIFISFWPEGERDPQLQHGSCAPYLRDPPLHASITCEITIDNTIITIEMNNRYKDNRTADKIYLTIPNG